MRPGLPPAVLLLAAPLLAACAHRAGASRTPAPEPDVVLLVDEEGPWREVPLPAGDHTPAPKVAATPAAPPPVHVPPPGLHAQPTRPVLAVPRRRATAAPRALGSPPVKGPRALARERYLDHPTRIRADRITFYCPKAFLPEVNLTADDVREAGPGRRIARGRARLTCRELTLEATSITLRVREAEDADLQVTARCNASLVTDQRGKVLREEGARSLILTNDRIVPLR